VGNKIDLTDERKISFKEAQNLANTYEMKYFEASAKLNKGVSECFEALMGQVYRKKILGEGPEERATIVVSGGQSNQN